jgi:hypothetical protein
MGQPGGRPHQPCHGLERPCSQRKTQRRPPPLPPEIRMAGMRSSGLSSPSRRGRRHDGGPQRPPLLLEALWLWEEPTQPSRGPSFLKLRRGRARGCRQSGQIGVVTMTRCSGSASSKPTPALPCQSWPDSSSSIFHATPAVAEGCNKDAPVRWTAAESGGWWSGAHERTRRGWR